MRSLWRRRLAKVPGPGEHKPRRETAPKESASSLAIPGQADRRLAGAFHNMAAEVVDRHLRTGRRGFALCGAAAGVGVTTTSANLAVALAQSGVSTLLVEANLRDPGLGRMFAPHHTGPGLQDLLRHNLRAADVIEVIGGAHLSAIFAGDAAPDAADLVASDAFARLIDTCMREFECTIVDTPPANRFADARTVATTVGYAIIVGRRRLSFLDDISLLAEQLRQDNVEIVGTIFNEG